MTFKVGGHNGKWCSEKIKALRDERLIKNQFRIATKNENLLREAWIQFKPKE